MCFHPGSVLAVTAFPPGKHRIILPGGRRHIRITCLPSLFLSLAITGTGHHWHNRCVPFLAPTVTWHVSPAKTVIPVTAVIPATAITPVTVPVPATAVIPVTVPVPATVVIPATAHATPAVVPIAVSPSAPVVSAASQDQQNPDQTIHISHRIICFTVSYAALPRIRACLPGN